MIGAIVVGNYRDFESWRRARFAVCSVLDFTRSLSLSSEHRRLAADIDRLSVSILDTLARGYEGTSDDAFLTRALDSVDRLERALRRASDQRAISAVGSHRLQRELKGLRRELQRASQGTTDK